MLEIANLSHSFDGRAVLKDITATVEDGEIAVIMGSSGGGKTTLLKCIAGLITPTSGDVKVEGVSIRQNASLVRSKIGLVFQYAALLDYLSVGENVLFGLRRKRKLSRQEEKEVLETQLANVGLEGIQDMMPDELSGGMKKRVGLARALCMEPELLLYDEPTSGLDPVTAYSIDQLIVETRNRLGVTSVVVSHDVSSVLRVADKILFLEKGDLVFHGTPAEFKSASSGAIKDLVEKARSESLEK
ncbi:ATP-binding cassette domain-containing protein [Kamptonema cortianum]|nr:ATP-binding cassette domain-containing protein [Geitlerinema splendidum]MDK3158574.1 ATP-binding cassette domain-containing protein [Kamptonema cortianum]